MEWHWRDRVRSVPKYIVPFLALYTAGCTVIRVEGAEARLAGFGVLKVAPVPGGKAVVYRTEGVGLVPGINGATLGYQSEVAAVIYDLEGCQVFIMELPDDLAAEAKWRSLLEEYPEICVLKGGNHGTENE